MHVLVIEHTRAGTESLTYRLQRAGFTVTTAADGRAALTVLGRRPVGAIVCDPALLLDDGSDFLSRLAAEHPRAAPRVVFVTARADEPAVRAVLRETRQPAFTEPCDVGALAAAVRGLGDDPVSRRVLVIEDDPANRSAISRAIQQAGFEVYAADDGISGYNALRKRTYGVIVCDIRMPYLGGKSFFEQIEEVFPNMAGRVVFVTAWAHEEKTRRFLEQTGQPFLPKPYDVQQLTDAVASIARRPF